MLHKVELMSTSRKEYVAETCNTSVKTRKNAFQPVQREKLKENVDRNV